MKMFSNQLKPKQENTLRIQISKLKKYLVAHFHRIRQLNIYKRINKKLKKIKKNNQWTHKNLNY